MSETQLDDEVSVQSERKIKNLKDAVQYAMHDAKSQNLMQNFAKRRETIPNV